MERLVIDTETSGLSPRFNKVLTVGMLHIEVEKDFLEILDSKHLFVKHEDYCANPFALMINKINLKEHDQIADPPKKVCKEINSFIKENKLKKTTLVGHNIRFDNGFLDALSLQGKTKLNLHTKQEDTMQFWKDLKNKNLVSNEHKNSLKTLANFFNIDYSKAHGALEDCRITANVYHRMLGMNM